jgi:hypothetical protein
MMDQRLSGKQKIKRFYKWYRLGVDNSDKWDSSRKRSRFHIFFTIYINDLPDVVQNIANLFLDDTKVYAIVNKEEEQHSLQNEKTTECIGQISGS